jgi:hypothetical protein
MDDLSKSCKQATLQLDGNGTLYSPFVGQSFDEIAKAVRSLRLDNGSDLNYIRFRFLDGEGIDKDWARLAIAEDAEEKNDTVKAVKVKVGLKIYDSTMVAVRISIAYSK